MVIRVVAKFADDQGIKEYKFKNRHGQTNQDAKWIEGMNDNEYRDENEEVQEDPPNQPFITTYDEEYLANQDPDEDFDEDYEEEIIFEENNRPLDTNEVESQFNKPIPISIRRKTMKGQMKT